MPQRLRGKDFTNNCVGSQNLQIPIQKGSLIDTAKTAVKLEMFSFLPGELRTYLKKIESILNKAHENLLHRAYTQNKI